MTIELHARLARALAAFGLLSLLAVATCGDDSGSGSSETETSSQTSLQTAMQDETSTQTANLTINYFFPPGVSCDQNEESVQSIRVELGESGAYGSAIAVCDNAGGEVVLSGIDAGSYDLFVLGIDDESDAVLDNRGGSADDDVVETVVGGDQVVDVSLGLAPARLEVRMVVDFNGFPAQCSSDEIMIKGVRVEAWDFTNADLLNSHDFDSCEFDGGFAVVPDMAREINGRRFDGIVIQPLDVMGGAVGSTYDVQLEGPVGAGKLVQVIIECEGDVCDTQVF
jgi:hypothetical protein